jgi:hypothetical protein
MSPPTNTAKDIYDSLITLDENGLYSQAILVLTDTKTEHNKLTGSLRVIHHRAIKLESGLHEIIPARLLAEFDELTGVSTFRITQEPVTNKVVKSYRIL